MLFAQQAWLHDSTGKMAPEQPRWSPLAKQPATKGALDRRKPRHEGTKFRHLTASRSPLHSTAVFINMVGACTNERASPRGIKKPKNLKCDAPLRGIEVTCCASCETSPSLSSRAFPEERRFHRRACHDSWPRRPGFRASGTAGTAETLFTAGPAA